MVKRVWPRKRYHQDAVAQELDEAAEAVGATIVAFDGIGGGVNDRLMGYHGRCFLIEYKTPGSGKGLRKTQKDFRDWWQGQWAVVSTQDELFATLGVSIVVQSGGKPTTVRDLRRPTREVLTIPGLRLTLDPTTGELVIGDRVSLLSPVQTDLMAFLVANAGTPFSCTVLLGAVWEYPPGEQGCDSLVRMHVGNIREKSRSPYPLARRGFGYYMPREPE